MNIKTYIKGLLTTMLIGCMCHSLYAQPDLDFDLDALLYKIKDDRTFHIDFHKSLESIRRPSTLSSILNYRKHSNGYQKDPFIMDGDLNLPIAIKGPQWGNTLHTFHVVPRFKFRIFQNDLAFPYGPGDISNPVRTPSAMPGAAWYMTTVNLWEDSHNPIDNYGKDYYFGLYVYHHSNGQDGNELDTFQNQIRVNLYNGNFGEQLVFEPTVGGRIHFISEGEDKEPTGEKLGGIYNYKLGTDHLLYWQVSYEWRPDAITNKTFDLYNIYGKNRLRILLTLQTIPTIMEQIFDGLDYVEVTNELRYEKFRYNFELSYILDANYASGDINALKHVGLFNLEKRLNAEFTFHFIPSNTKTLALFAKIGYTASDEYNIYFQDAYFQISGGLSFAFFDQPDWQKINLHNFGL